MLFFPFLYIKFCFAIHYPGIIFVWGWEALFFPFQRLCLIRSRTMSVPEAADVMARTYLYAFEKLLSRGVAWNRLFVFYHMFFVFYVSLFFLHIIQGLRTDME